MRKERGMTQEQLAAHCHRAGWDIDRIIIAKIEVAEREVTDLELRLLCQVLKVSPNDLFVD